MRVNWNYIKGFLLLVLVGFLFAFSSSRNQSRKITELEVKFLDDNNLFVTHETVNKLLIQNGETVTNVPKEILDLNGLENALKSNAMIKTAEVYLAVNGKVRADVVQRKPIARVSTNASYYIDDEGKYMPLSTNYTAHVPIVTGSVEKNNLANIFKIASKIYEDEFLKTHIVEIHQEQDQTLSLKTRVYDFEIELGDLNDLDKKINNLKAFYQKTKKDKTLSSYKKVNLQFNNQVVCTKK
ncbi:MAG: cell division protein FtsQ/DivIB [Flavobacteriaceae bacterium]|nr:cell division protein FtsQ/DivIB [Flavobacteriaceae bacterium]